MKETAELLQKGISALSETVTNLTREVEVLQTRKTELQGDVSKLEADFSAKQSIFENKIKELEGLVSQKEKESGKLSTDITDKTKIVEALSKSSDLITTERNKLVEPLDGLRNTILDITKKISPLFTEVTSTINEAKKMAEDSKKQSVELFEVIEVKTNNLSKRESTVAETEKDLAEKAKKVDILVNRLTSTN